LEVPSQTKPVKEVIFHPKEPTFKLVGLEEATSVLVTKAVEIGFVAVVVNTFTVNPFNVAAEPVPAEVTLKPS
jgi:hypothetical protein